MEVKVGMRSDLRPTGSAGARERARAYGIGIQRGFTLLEMVLVLFLMALVASAGLMLTEGVEDQAKYDETKRRMELIRKAIVGDPTRTINGAPEIGGFVADMGRLPLCVAELLDLGDEIMSATIPRTFQSPCTDTVVIPEAHDDANSGLTFGWRGPYVQLLTDSDGQRRLRDGYENDDGSVNFGWGFSNDNLEIKMQSPGMNGRFDGGTPVDDFPQAPSVATAPALVNERDYRARFQNWNVIKISLENSGTTTITIDPNDLRLVLSFADVSQPNAIGTDESATFPSATIVMPSTTSAGSIAVASGNTLTVPAGTTLSGGNSLSFASVGVVRCPAGEFPVSPNDTVTVPTGSSQTGSSVNIGANGTVSVPVGSAVTLSTSLTNPPDVIGQYSLILACNDPANPNAVDGKRYDGDCTRYGTDAAPVAYTPTNQPYLFRAAPRGTPILPPSPLTWTIK